MKLWQKTCIYSLLLFFLVFICSGIVMIEHNTKSALNRRLNQASSEQIGISSGLMRYVMLERVKNSTRNGSHDPEYTEEYLESRVNAWGLYLEIRDENQVFYSNLEPYMSAVLDYDAVIIYSEYWISKIDNKDYLFLISRIPLKDRDLQNTYILDVSDVYSDRTQQYHLFIQVTIAVSVLLTAGMYLITRQLTKSLRTPLTEVVGYADLLRSTVCEESVTQELGEHIFHEGKG